MCLLLTRYIFYNIAADTNGLLKKECIFVREDQQELLFLAAGA